jgi:hypothetical protein
MADNEKIPVGSLPPEPAVVPEMDKANDTPSVDYEKNFTELHKKFGEQSNEVGSLRKQNEALMEKLSAIEQNVAKKEEVAREQEPPTNYEQQLRELASKYDDGEITAEDLMIESNRLTKAQTMAEAEERYGNLLEKANQQFNETLSARDQEKIVEQFNEQNPEFSAWKESGELDAVIQSNPLHDELSAYYALKAQKAQEALEAGRLKEGSEPAKKVLNKPGSTIQQANKPKGQYTAAEIRESALAAARAAAAG